MAHIPRIYIPGRLGPGPMTLDGEQARRLAAVMRLRSGDEFRVFAGDGREWRAVAGEASRGGLRAEVADVVRQEPLPQRVVEIWCSIVRPNRFDWAIEKCVEAGADIIRPLIAQRGARGEGSSKARQERWGRIAVEAMEQSGRLHPAVVEKPMAFEEALGRHRGALILADGDGKSWSEMAPLLPERGTIAVAVGPEGGWSEEEVLAARGKGALVVSFALNTLRTETAAVVATALLRAR